MPQNNLYYTDHSMQYNCLFILTANEFDRNDNRIISYCMNEFSLQFQMENNKYESNFTFVQLATENITSAQLYAWSAPIDLIEQYQIYLHTKNSSLANEIYVNCSWPRFGLQCQYEFDLDDYNFGQTIVFTCYIHLQCNRQLAPACLDWTDICDGKIDCLDNAIDEQNCLQLEINECKNDEYRCLNGQCIPKLFEKDNKYVPDCLDRSDEIMRPMVEYFASSKSVTVYKRWEHDATCRESSLTSSCEKTRQQTLLKAMFSIQDESIHDRCWSAFKDLIYAPDLSYRVYNRPCNEMDCLENIEKYCPEMLFIPSVSVAFGDIYLAYRKIDAEYYYNNAEYPIHYICTNNPTRYNDFFKNYSKISFKDKLCFHSTFQTKQSRDFVWHLPFEKRLDHLLIDLHTYKPIVNYSSNICNRSHMYQCQNSSKCISIYRIKDSFSDCPYSDDENDDYIITNNQLIEKLQKTHFKCSKLNLYISYLLVDDGFCHCRKDTNRWCDDEKTKEFNPQQSISFQTICNGFTQLIPQFIDGRNETDETECQDWPCNNIYTRCNGLWDCPNGLDEIGCLTSSVLNCSIDYHLCLSLQTYQFQCLSKEKVLDGNIDCVGATDEPNLCRVVSETIHEHRNRFYCLKNSSKLCLNQIHMCNGEMICDDGSDEGFCTTNRSYGEICSKKNEQIISDREKFFCPYFESRSVKQIIFFRLNETKIPPLPPPQNEYLSNSPLVDASNDLKSACNHGLPLKVWLNDETNSTTMTCICPPNYYGETCQYQNQRLTLTIQFRALSDSLRIIFAIIISLIDDSQQRIVHSYEQISYVSIRDCEKKFQIYLDYATRKKDLSKNYFLHIDFYEKVSLKYRGSILLPIKFSFLPVHRLAFLLEIPKTVDNQRRCSNKKCGIHGKCIQYANQPIDSSFCSCEPGWSGQFCTIKHTCTCSSDSTCIGITAKNRSICVCPMNKFGPRCLLTNSLCQSKNSSLCHQHGSCIPNDDYMLYNKTFTCICSNGYSGKECEYSDRKLTFIFHEDVLTSQNIFIHFFQVRTNDVPRRSTFFRQVFTGQNLISIQWSLPFHMIFIEIEKKFYFVHIDSIYPSDRCPNLTELFNQTFLQWNPLRQIKYYHLPCQNVSLNLSCFHDTKHLCLCQNLLNNRVANCFVFDHQMKYDCLGQNECENNASCLHDIPNCPRRSMCICPACYYGSRCQFSTNVFGLSLDAILGYHILPKMPIIQQPLIVQFSLALTIIFLIVGLINGIFCLITFKSRVILEIGCGLYLLSSSITTLLTMIIFGLKFLIVLLTQMTLISNRTFLLSQCYSIDVLLRICLLMDQWLNACVAIDRTMTAIKGTRFNKKQSKQRAIYVIVFLLLIIIGTSIHDSFHRNLIDEQNEQNDEIKRIWCIVRYNSFFQFYNSIIQAIHFISAFAINMISTVILIVNKSRQEQILHPEKMFKKILQEQIQKYRHILISPLILVVLAMPRLIIIFISKCMQSANDSWLFLFGYFISFLPSMLTFVIFILPSKFYKKEFRKTVNHYRIRITRKSRDTKSDS